MNTRIIRDDIKYFESKEIVTLPPKTSGIHPINLKMIHNRDPVNPMCLTKFQMDKNNNLNIFELGLGTNNTDVAYNMGPSGRPGASLKSWKEFLPNSMIYGADIDKIVLFNEDRIKTFYCDQTNPDP